MADRIREDKVRKAKEKQSEIDKKRKKDQNDEEQKERIKLMKKNLVNKEFTYDYNGDLLFLSKQRIDPQGELIS